MPHVKLTDPVLVIMEGYFLNPYLPIKTILTLIS